MPSSCCVAGCSSNYKPSDNVKVFQFPNNEIQRNLWIKRISRINWTPGNRSVVCIHHFDASDIIKEDAVQRPDGSMLIVPRTHFKLKAGAVPCIFPNLPLKRVRKCKIRHKVQEKDAKLNNLIKSKEIGSFQELFEKNMCRSKLWKVHFGCSHVTYYKLNQEVVPLHISSCFTIHEDLTVEVFVNNIRACNSDLLFLCGTKYDEKLSIKFWSQIEYLFDFLDNIEGSV